MLCYMVNRGYGLPAILKFYICRHCGNLVELIQAGGGTLVCCGEPMAEMKPST